MNIQLQELKQNDLPISQYLQKAKSLADELSATGRTLTSSEFNAIVYRNTNKEFRSLISGLNMSPTPMSFNDLFAHFVSHEILIKSQEDPPLANLTYKPALLPTPSAAPIPPCSSFSTSPRPYFSTQHQPQPRSPWNTITQRRGPCQICGYNNHTADACRR